MGANERRIYQRGAHFYITAKVSRDGALWKEADVNDLSSSGLQLSSDDVYTIGDTVWFDLIIQGFFSEFEIKTQGIIRREKIYHGHNVYGVSFVGLTPDLKILIDENVQNDRPLQGNPYSLD